MQTYIIMLKWTPQGLQNVKQSPTRLDAARKKLEPLGVRLKEFYMVSGRFDVIAMAEASDDATLAKAVLMACLDGNITTETCRAFTEDEYRKICSALP